MARGPKPKPAHLHLVEGTNRTDRHGPEDELKTQVEQSQNAFGPLVKPESFLIARNKKADEAWERYIVPAWWLDASKEMLAIAYCKLVQEFWSKGPKFNAAKHGQLRAYGAELGLTDERKRPKNGTEKDDDLFD